MSSTVEICNVALVHLGAESISSLTDGTAQANACNAVWDQAREAVLRTHPWNFAIKTVELAQVASTDRVFRYDYKYNLPSDCVRLLRVYENDDYKVEGRAIYTDADTCKIKYIYDNETVSTWDPLFVELMSAKVMAKIAFSITRDLDISDFAHQHYETMLMRAQAIDSSEDIEDEIAEPTTGLISARF